MIEYEKFLGVEESLQILILQTVDQLYLEALKEEYIGYGGRTPYEMIAHLQMTKSNSKKRSSSYGSSTKSS